MDDSEYSMSSCSLCLLWWLTIVRRDNSEFGRGFYQSTREYSVVENVVHVVSDGMHNYQIGYLCSVQNLWKRSVEKNDRRCF